MKNQEEQMLMTRIKSIFYSTQLLIGSGTLSFFSFSKHNSVFVFKQKRFFALFGVSRIVIKYVCVTRLYL